MYAARVSLRKCLKLTCQHGDIQNNYWKQLELLRAQEVLTVEEMTRSGLDFLQHSLIFVALMHVNMAVCYEANVPQN